jgi:hypothetical protein
VLNPLLSEVLEAFDGVPLFIRAALFPCINEKERLVVVGGSFLAAGLGSFLEPFQRLVVVRLPGIALLA